MFFRLRRHMQHPTPEQRTVFDVANDQKCRAKDTECRKCKRIGHYAKCCNSSGAEKKKSKVKAVEQTSQDTDAYKLEYVYFAGNEGGRDFTIDIEINGKQVEMMIDTGCARTLVPKQWFKENINKAINSVPSLLHLEAENSNV